MIVGDRRSRRSACTSSPAPTCGLGRGELLTLACAVLFACEIVYTARTRHALHPIPFTTMQIVTVVVLSVAPAARQGVGLAHAR